MRISDWSSDVCSSDLRSIPWTIATARIRDRFTLRSGRHHFFDCRSFNPALPQHRVREQPFESRVLLLKRAQPLRFRYLQATELGLPRIIGRARPAVLPAKIRNHPTRLGLLQAADNLLFRKPLPLHLSVPSIGSPLAPPGGENGGRVTRSAFARA